MEEEAGYKYAAEEVYNSVNKQCHMNKEGSVRVEPSYVVTVEGTTYRAVVTKGGWALINIETDKEETTVEVSVSHLPALISLFSCLKKQAEAGEQDRVK